MVRNFATKNDLVEAYLKRRPGMKKSEVEDLINCYFNCIKDNATSRKSKDYAYEIPKLGYLYTTIFYIQMNRHRFKERFKAIIRDICFNTSAKRNYLKGFTLFKLRTKKMNNIELMKFQNEVAENN